MCFKQYGSMVLDMDSLLKSQLLQLKVVNKLPIVVFLFFLF